MIQNQNQFKCPHFVSSFEVITLMQGEKLLGSLGGIFSRTWKPKKGRTITGPVIMRGD